MYIYIYIYIYIHVCMYVFICTQGHSMIRSDHPSNTKREGVCTYCCKLNECTVNKITLSNVRCSLTCLYRSPTQNRKKFELFYETS